MRFLTLCGMLILVSGVTFGQGDIAGDDKVPGTEDDAITGESTPAPSAAPTAPVTTPTTPVTTPTTPVTTPTLKVDPAPVPVDPKKEKTPAKGDYYLSQNNKTCILLEMAGRLKFTYTKNADNETEKATVFWDIPTVTNGTKVGGQCDLVNQSNLQIIELTFFEGWKMTIKFNRTKDKAVFISDISLQYIMDTTRFPNTSESSTDPMVSSRSKEEFKVDKDKSFSCESKQSLSEFKGGNLTLLETWDLHVQAFRSDDKTKFGDPVKCDGDTTVSNLVPIIVGAALAGLVLIVLVAYLIGRHRNRQGYQSV